MQKRDKQLMRKLREKRKLHSRLRYTPGGKFPPRMAADNDIFSVESIDTELEEIDHLG